MCLTETWLGKHDTLNIAGYSHFCKIRRKNIKAKKNSGGVSILVKHELAKSVKEHKSKSQNIVWVILSRKEKRMQSNLIIGTVYLSPEGSSEYSEENTFDILKDELALLKNKYRNTKILIGGDFNAYTKCERDYMVPDYGNFDSLDTDDFTVTLPQRFNRDKRNVNNYGRMLLEFCMDTDLCIVNGRVGQDREAGGEYTCHFGSNPSVIDYVLCQSELLAKILDFRVDIRIESHHAPLVCLLQSTNAQSQGHAYNNTGNDLLKYVWNDEKKQSYLEAFKSNNLELVKETLDKNEFDNAVKILNEFIINSANGMQRNRIYNKSTARGEGWYDDECRTLKKNAVSKLRKFRKCRNSVLLEEYKLAKKHYLATYSMKKQFFINKEKAELLENVNSNESKEFWRAVSKYTREKPAMGNITLREWETYFKRLFVSPSGQLTYEITRDWNVINDELDLDISIQEVTKALNGVKTNKAAGYDGIPGDFYRVLQKELSNIIVYMFNKFFDGACFPLEWSKSLIVPIPKKGDLSKVENYKGITLLPILSKVFTQILKERLLKWCESKNLICQEQAGFRRNYSTIDNVFVLDTVIRKYLRKRGGRFYCAFVDLTKAFDSVNHKALWKKLQSYHISTKMLNILMSVYENVQSAVLSSIGVSSFFRCEVGVRQGCILSPILFSIFINDFPDAFQDISKISLITKEINTLLFADDIVLFSESKIGLQKQLNILESYCDTWSLKVNLDKSKIIVFRNGGPLKNYEKWNFKGQNMLTCTYYNYLGLQFSSAHAWSYNQKIRAERAGRAVYGVKNMLNKLQIKDNKVMFKIFYSKILPILHYGSEIWGFDKCVDIERVHVGFCKSMLKLHRNTPDVAVRGELGRVPLKTYRYYNIINYWLRLLTHNQYRLTKEAYSLQLIWVESNVKCWAYKVKELLLSYGFGEVWYNQGVGNKSMFKIAFKNRCNDIAMQNWHAEVEDMDRLRYYKMFKTVLSNEEYIEKIKKEDLSAYSNFRCNSLPLRGLTGRLYENLEYRDCKCLICNTEAIEDEYHFLVICPVYISIRQQYLPSMLYNAPTKNKFIQFMELKTNASINCTVAYLKRALQERDRIRSERHTE